MCRATTIAEFTVTPEDEGRSAWVQAGLRGEPEPLVYRVAPSPNDRGFDVYDPAGGAIAWAESYEAAMVALRAAASGALSDRTCPL